MKFDKHFMYGALLWFCIVFFFTMVGCSAPLVNKLGHSKGSSSSKYVVAIHKSKLHR